MADACRDPRLTAFGTLLEVTAAVTAAVGRDLEARAGLPVAWFELLLHLDRTPRGRLRMADLAGPVALSTSGLTRLVDRVEAAGLVRREACSIDRRGQWAVLTPAGRRVLADALPAQLESIERHVAGPLGARGLAQLESLLRSLADATRSTRKA